MNKIINDREIIVNDETYIAVDDDENTHNNCRVCAFYHSRCFTTINKEGNSCRRNDVDIHWIKKYPYYGKNSLNLIIEFEDKETGTVVDSGETIYNIGHHSYYWTEKHFVRLTDKEVEGLESYLDYNKQDATFYLNEAIKGEKTMKYEMIKPISGKTIIQEGACEDEAVEFINKFGISTEIEWTKEIEVYMMKQNGWIEFALDKKFIKEVEIEYDENKLYFYKCITSGVYKLNRINNIEYSLSSINTNGYFTRSYSSFNKIINDIHVKSFDTIQEAMSFYFPKEVIEQTELEKVQEAKDILDLFGVSVICDGCELDVNCIDCPLDS